MAGWKWLDRCDVNARAAQLAGMERVGQGHLIDEPATTDVDEKRAMPHPRNPACVNQVSGLRRQRDMQ